MTLNELTNQESGIIIYDTQSRSLAVVNWSGCDEDESIPIFYPPFGWYLPFPFDGFNVARQYTTNDIMDDLPGTIWSTGETDSDGTLLLDTDLDIVHDYNDDLIKLYLDDNKTAGTVYELENGIIVIAPQGWH